MFRLNLAVLLCCFALLTGGVKTSGQTITGVVRGIVTDPTGAVVNGARITVSNVATGVSNNTFSDPSGLYNFQFLPIGTYTIAATASGFDTTSVSPFTLEIDQVANLNVKLQAGQVSTTVSVDSELGPILNTESAALGSTISSSTISNIPLNGRNFSSATQFLPGAVSA